MKLVTLVGTVVAGVTFACFEGMVWLSAIGPHFTLIGHLLAQVGLLLIWGPLALMAAASTDWRIGRKRSAAPAPVTWQVETYVRRSDGRLQVTISHRAGNGVSLGTAEPKDTERVMSLIAEAENLAAEYNALGVC